MAENNRIDISEELDNKVQPWIKYLIENYNNPNKVNSCLDVASENIRFLESIINQANSRLRDFKTLKRLTLGFENERRQQNNQPPLPETISLDEPEK